MTATASPMTTEEIYALPEDDWERDLIRGELRVYRRTLRTRLNGLALAAVSEILGTWGRQNGNQGEFAASNVGVRLSRNPETFVGMDVTYFSAELLTQRPAKQEWYEGPPMLAVEILSPSDSYEDVVEKINLYLECGVPVVWILDPDFQTLTIYRPKTAPSMLRAHETLDGHPELPGLSAPVQDFFN